MAKQTLVYEDANMHSRRSGSHAVSAHEWTAIQPRLKQAKHTILNLHKTREQGFMHLPSDKTMVAEVKRIAGRIDKGVEHLVVLGIGGSDLGARALHQALLPDGAAKGRPRLHFAGNSTDPDDLYRLLKQLDFKKTCVNVISKSGDTLETMTAFLILRERLIHALGKSKFASRVIATTDPDHGSLHDVAVQENYHNLPIPQNVGGRFSVFSSVGLFPALMAGIRIDDLLYGARSMAASFQTLVPSRHPALVYAALHVIGMEKRKQNIHVLMPYSKQLIECARWVRQLVAESLGKKKKGPTPVAALGPEDQHSQLQLYAEGPYDKLITFVEVTAFAHDVTTPKTRLNVEALNRFGDKRFADIIHLERHATAESLRRLNRPNGTIFLDQIHERSIGELMMFFELAVAAMGELLDIDAYNQPGVELSKKIMRDGLKKL